MLVNIAVCDDEEKDRMEIVESLDGYSFSYDVEFNLDPFSDGKKLLDSYRKKGDYHIVFLDVEMSKTDGLQIADVIRKTRDKDAYIIFISNYPEYMKESFKVHPFYYLSKPVSREKMKEIMDEILKEMSEAKVYHTLVHIDGREEVVNIRDILYIESAKMRTNHLIFHFAETTANTKGKIYQWKEILQEYSFYECYRGILVNLQHIHYFKERVAVLDNGERIPLSKTAEKELKNLYMNKVTKI